jgi:hypothetical protein
MATRIHTAKNIVFFSIDVSVLHLLLFLLVFITDLGIFH